MISPFVLLLGLCAAEPTLYSLVEVGATQEPFETAITSRFFLEGVGSLRLARCSTCPFGSQVLKDCTTVSDTVCDFATCPVVEFNPTDAARRYSTIHANQASGVGHGQGRLDSPQAWSAMMNFAPNEWAQLDLGASRMVVQAIVQARRDGGSTSQRVTRFRIFYSDVDVDQLTSWTAIDGGAEFDGPANGVHEETKVRAVFKRPVSARFWRIVPTAMSGHTSLRWGVGVCLPSAPATNATICVPANTPNEYRYNFLGAIAGNSVTFEVAASNDAHVLLSNNARSENNNEVYELVISGWGNTQSVIRKGKQTANLAQAATQNLLNLNTNVPLWISWTGNSVSFGRGRIVGTDVIFTYTDPNPTPITTIAVSTGWGSAGRWNVCGLLDSSRVLYNENFNGFTGGTVTGSQFQSNRALAHSRDLFGWSKSGTNAFHSVFLEANSPNHAIMFFSNNVATQVNGFAANIAGVNYLVSFLVSPAVYVANSEITSATDALQVTVLRADNNVLATTTIMPGAWAGNMRLTPFSFVYTGDGSGNVRLRLGCSRQENRFCGAIDQLFVTRAEQ